MASQQILEFSNTHEYSTDSESSADSDENFARQRPMQAFGENGFWGGLDSTFEAETPAPKAKSGETCPKVKRLLIALLLQLVVIAVCGLVAFSSCRKNTNVMQKSSTATLVTEANASEKSPVPPSSPTKAFLSSELSASSEGSSDEELSSDTESDEQDVKSDETSTISDEQEEVVVLPAQPGLLETETSVSPKDEPEKEEGEVTLADYFLPSTKEGVFTRNNLLKVGRLGLVAGALGNYVYTMATQNDGSWREELCESTDAWHVLCPK